MLFCLMYWRSGGRPLQAVLNAGAPGVLGGLASETGTPEQIEAVVKPILATMGMFGTLVLIANFIWAYNLFRTCAGWEQRTS